MSLNAKYVIRAITVFLLGFLGTWMATNEPWTWSLLVGAIVTGLNALAEFLGPGSDVGVKWTNGKP